MKKPKQNVLVNVLGIPIGVSKSKERMLTEDENNVVNIKKDFEEFDADEDYKAGDVVYYKDSIYKFILDHTGEWNEDDVERTNVYNILKEGSNKNLVLTKKEFDELETIDMKTIYYVTKNDTNPLCFTSLADGSIITLRKKYKGYSSDVQAFPNDFEISTNKIDWEPYTINQQIVLNEGEKVYFRNVSDVTKQLNNYVSGYGVGYYAFDGNTNTSRFNISGDITTMLNKNGNIEELTFDHAFVAMFERWSGYSCFVDASELILPKNITDASYELLFNEQSTLINAPILPFNEINRSFGLYRILYNTNIPTLTCLATKGDANYLFNHDELGLPSAGGTFKCKHAIDWNWEDILPSNWIIEYLD